MGNFKKAGLFILAAVGALSMPFTGCAEEKINSVSVRLESEGLDEWGRPEVTAEVKSGHYSAGSAFSANDYYESDSAYYDDPEVFVIELDAEDGYYFNITKADKIRLSGLGAEFLKASRQNNGSNLYITVRLSGTGSFVGEIEEAGWTQDGHGTWSEAYGAKSYSIRFTDEKNRMKIFETSGTTYDFRPLMQKAGNYSFQVKPVSNNGEGGEWIDASSISVSDEMALANKGEFEVKKEITYQDGVMLPSNQIVTYLNTGWQQTDDGKYWYRNTDGTYPQSSWLQDGGSWYWFGQDGTMAVNEYITYGSSEYYIGPDGRMLTNGTAPDGRKADEEGKLANGGKK